MRALAYVSRFVVMIAVMWWFAWAYALGRARTWFVPKGEPRRAAVARLRGRTLRRAMAALGATFVKLGQVLSTRPDLLDDEIIEELRQLQDRMPPFPFEKVRRIVEEDLGARLEDRFAEFDERPIAAASVAQVHRARLRDGAEVAVKVLRPDIRRKVQRDEAILLFLARGIALHPRLRLSDPVGHLRHFCDGILEQTDLTVEARNYERFRRNFAKVSRVRFPRVHDELSGPRVMTMEFVRGTKVDALPPGDHRELGGLIQHVILKMCFEDGFLHADLHPGNLLVGDDGVLIIFDVGLVKELHERLLVEFMDFTKCLTMGGPRDFMEHLKTFHTYAKDVDWVAIEKDIVALVGKFRSRNVAELEIGQLANDLFAIARRHRVRPVPDLALVIVGLVTAEGIGKQLHPENNLFESTARFLMPILAQRGLSLVAGAPPPAVA